MKLSHQHFNSKAYPSSKIPRTGSGGFTLVETVIGMAIVSFVFMALYLGISHGFKIILTSQQNMRATQVMLEKMETIRLYSWTQLLTSDFIPTSFVAALDPADTDIEDLSEDEVFNGKVAIEASGLGTSYAADMRKVTITLTWKTSGRPQERSMTTLVSKNGLQNYIY
jgi:prepilin-type N-terminal cleavage/methylation domain-containing protein